MIFPIQKLGWVGKSIKNCSVIKIDGITNENISIFSGTMICLQEEIQNTLYCSNIF